MEIDLLWKSLGSIRQYLVEIFDFEELLLI